MNISEAGRPKGYKSIIGGVIALFTLPIILFFLSESSLRAERTPDLALKGLPVRTDGTVGMILKRGKIVVGLQRDYRPYHIDNPQTDYPGIDVEVARLLAEELGVNVEFQFFTLPELFDAVVKKRVDLALGGVSATIQRSLFVNFTDPYLITTPAALLDRKLLPPVTQSPDFQRQKLESLSDIRNLGRLRLGVKAGTTHEQILKSDPAFQIHDIQVYPDRPSLVKALEDGELDALIADGVYISALMLLKPEYRNRFFPLIKKYQEEHISMVVPAHDDSFVTFLNFFIKEAGRTGKLRQIQTRYLADDGWIH